MKNSVKKSLVFLPGWGFKVSIWNDIANSYNEYDIKQLDLPTPAASATLATLTHELANQIPNNSTIVAWSLSGLFATYLSHQSPHKCAHLILINSLPKFVSNTDWVAIPTANAKHFQQQANTDLEQVLTTFTTQVQFPAHSATRNAYLNQHVFSATDHYDSLLHYLNLLLTADVSVSFKKLTMSIHCLFGGKDAIIPLPASEQLSALNSNATINIIHAAGHIPFLTHTTQFKSWLTGVLND
jgi:pimeloyl-[acyl-carrier protein] methyl ester esterase